MPDDIIKELWKIKDGIAQEHSYDLDALIAHLRTRKYKGDHKVVDLRSIKEEAEQGAQSVHQQHDGLSKAGLE